MPPPAVFDVVVVGGGAAGLFCAIAAARAGAPRVLCLESGSAPLRKVAVSGGGRCNVMHSAANWRPREAVKLLAGRYPRGARQLGRAALTSPGAGFSPAQTARWFEAEGVQLVAEPDGRVFPSTNDSATVVSALLAAARDAGVELRLRSKVTGIERLGGGDAGQQQPFHLQYTQRGGSGAELVTGAAAVLATGSASHPLAAGLGHQISPLIPSLFAFRLPADGPICPPELAGVSVPDAELTLEGCKAAVGRGALLVTHRGVSGPAALRLSSFAAAELAAVGYTGTLRLNLAPGLREAEVDAELRRFRTAEDTRRRQLGSAVPFGLPRRLWVAVAAGAGLDLESRWGELGEKVGIKAAVGAVRRTRLPFAGKDSNKEEFVTAGRAITMRGTAILWRSLLRHCLLTSLSRPGFPAPHPKSLETYTSEWDTSHRSRQAE